MSEAFAHIGSAVRVDPGSSDWKNFFSRYSEIVLVANSAETDIERLGTDFPGNALFIFFNKVYKVLDEPFNRPSILACRSGMMGANIVHRREAPEVISFFDPSTFIGIVNVAIMPEEKFSPPEAFARARVKHLFLGDMLSPFYPPDKFPTTGFGLCIWLRSMGLPGRICLAGFSSKRSDRWKVFDVHDWTFEQVVLRLLARRGEIELMDSRKENPYAALQTHFPEFSATDIALTANEVLSDRLLNLGSVVDRLMSVTKILRFLDNSFRQIRPKTRKQRFLLKQKKE